MGDQVKYQENRKTHTTSVIQSNFDNIIHNNLIKQRKNKKKIIQNTILAKIIRFYFMLLS